MDEVLPVANELDPRHEDIPAALLDRMGELGLFGVLIPEDEGGLGLGVYEYCLVSEELARAWMSVGSIIARGNGTGCDSADPDRRLALRRASAAGQRIGAIAFSEPEAGSDLANVACRAERTTGSTRWVVHRHQALGRPRARPRTSSTCSPARARRARTAGPSDGLELFLVEKERGSSPTGVTGTPIDKIGYFGLTTWELELDGLRLPADALQDTGEEEGQGFKHSLGWLHVARAQTAARAVGLARGALEDALTYCQQRVQFGEPIGNQQVIRHMLADMSAEVAAARQLYQHAAWLVDAGRAGQHRDLAGQAVRLRDGRAGHQPGAADLRRQRLHHPVRRRALLARRPAHPDLRGHLRDPAADHRRQPARGRAGRRVRSMSFDAAAALDDLQRRTTERLAALTGDYAGIVEASRDSNADDEHDPEGSTIAFERSQVGTLVEDARHQLAEVDGRPRPAGRGDLRHLRAVRRTDRRGTAGGAADRPHLHRAARPAGS